MNTGSPAFPFSALHGQSDLQTALLLAAIDPLIGGVLIQGPRGTAKSTSARALADLLPQGQFVNLPLGASEEQLIGSLDIEAALQKGRVDFRPGLLARAHDGVLYVDEVNLLADHLVDLLLDVAASGINHIERDGISHRHEARFVLVGTMNPEEGELRPQLLDRFGLMIALPAQLDATTRQQIVRTRLQFDADPRAFLLQAEPQQQSLRQQILAARQRLAQLHFSDALHQQVSELCCAAQVEGVRADLVLLRAARAHAALQQRDMICAQDIEAVAEWALAHRRLAPAEFTNARSQGTPDASASDNTDGQSRNRPNANTSATPAAQPENPWGALPAEPTPILPLNSVRPLPLKKP